MHGPTRDPAGPMGGMQGCVVAGLGKQEGTSTPEHKYSCCTHQFLESVVAYPCRHADKSRAIGVTRV